MDRKVFVLDTSAIIALVQDITTFRGVDAPGFAGVLGDNEIIVPRVVLDELTKLRRRVSDERATIATQAARQLEQYSSEGSLLDGVETEKGGMLRIAARPAPDKMAVWGLDSDNPDHEILATAISIEDTMRSRGVSEEQNGEHPVVLITQDRIQRVLARSIYGLAAEELESVCAPEFDSEPGFRKLEVDADVIDRCFDSGEFKSTDPLSANTFVYLVDRENPTAHYCYGICREHNSREVEIIDRAKVDYLKVAGEVVGRNVRQKLLLWALMGCGQPDPMAEGGVRLIVASGPAGSGKSFLTLAAAWERLERGHFERIIITRPMVDVGTSMGFLPGTLEEKLRPWGGPIEDNLRAIVQVPSPNEGRGGAAVSKRGVQRSLQPFDAKTWLEMEDRLEMVPLTYVRGRTFRKCFVILEEAQNLERGPLKVLLTRLGEGSVVVVLGDKSQIDHQFLSARNNGLVHAINAFRNWPQAIHVQLKQIVRSDLAEAASIRL